MIFTYVVVFFEVGFVRIMDLTVVVVHKTAPIFSASQAAESFDSVCAWRARKVGTSKSVGGSDRTVWNVY